MKESVKNKLETLLLHHEELSALLSSSSVINNQEKFRSLSKEYSDLMPIIAVYKEYKATLENIEVSQELIKDVDEDIKYLAEEELQEAEENIVKLEQDLNFLLLPKDPNDTKNVFLEIRAGAGGDEAAIFAGDLFRMYSRYAEKERWTVELISYNSADQGGYKEIIGKIIGNGAYSKLKFESGAHRVQRVPVTEAQGRIHTSTCTIAVIPESEEIESIDINPADLRIDTYRASGAGGQHVNRTDSAVRLTHIPTGVVVECQAERSQHKNKAKAMSLLKARILAKEQEKQQKEQAENRRNLVGSGDRSERIRTYNFPQGRVTDHRINITLYKLDDIIAGDLSPVIDPLIREHQMDLLASVGE